jgi:hypothetical protein
LARNRQNEDQLGGFYLIFYFLVGLGFEVSFALAKEVLYCLSHTSSSFCSGYFGAGISQMICLGWPHAMILQISASQVARITGVSHQSLANLKFFMLNFQ